MIIKNADDKTKRLNLLTELSRSDRLDARQRQWAEDELVRMKRGIEGERDAAFYIDSYLKDSKNHAVLHDLRIEVDGDIPGGHPNCPTYGHPNCSTWPG